RNLINNAIKFTPKEGLIHLTGEKKDKTICFGVKDTGIGIAPEELPYIFDPQSRQSKQGTQNEKGNGLGLFISKSLVESNQGQIWVESQIQKGSTFYFSLPPAPTFTNQVNNQPALYEKTKMLPPFLL
ncbi:MAG: ATP-binding protein, partial [Bacteroidota bacterium]